MTADQIKQLRSSLSLTQHELSLLLNVRRETIARWECRKQRPQGSHVVALQRLASKLDGAATAEDADVLAEEVPVA